MTVCFLVIAVGLLLFQMADTVWLPLQAWDESRLAVNAIEMLITGNHLVTTFGFVPDLWNTKPPLVINLMAISMRIFGTTLFALRLPSALSAVFTVVLIARFARNATGSLGCGLFAGLVLLAMPLFSGAHGGGTGDYDAPLALLTTAYGIILFGLIHAEQRQPARAALAGCLVGLAILAKGIAGLIPGVGIAGYALAFGLPMFWRRLPDYLVVVGVGLSIGISYYVFRSFFDMDYIHAVQLNELGGRFTVALDHHDFGPGFYFYEVTGNPPHFKWQASLLLFLPGLFMLPPGRSQRLGIFGLFFAGGIFLVYTTAATKLSWYIIPALPWLAISIAMGGFAIYQRIETATGRGDGRPLPPVAPILTGLLALALAASAVHQRYIVHATNPDLRAFGILINQATKLAPGQTLTVIDGGYPNNAGFANYSPTLRFHRLAAGLADIRVNEANSLKAAANAKLIGSCDARLVSAVGSAGHKLWQGSNCVIIRPYSGLR